MREKHTRTPKPQRLIFRVEPYRENRRHIGWLVERNGRGRTENALFKHEWGETKRDAVQYAVNEARLYKPSQVIIHGRAGQIQREMTYGADPRRSKG